MGVRDLWIQNHEQHARSEERQVIHKLSVPVPVPNNRTAMWTTMWTTMCRWRPHAQPFRKLSVLHPHHFRTTYSILKLLVVRPLVLWLLWSTLWRVSALFLSVYNGSDCQLSTAAIPFMFDFRCCVVCWCRQVRPDKWGRHRAAVAGCCSRWYSTAVSRLLVRLQIIEQWVWFSSIVFCITYKIERLGYYAQGWI